MNKLAYGIERDVALEDGDGSSSIVFESSSSAAPLRTHHKSVVSDSLFMDNEDKPNPGGYSDDPMDDRKPWGNIV